MLLGNSISGTKNFFTKTIHSFKSLFSCGSYQKLQKNPHHIDMNNNDLDNFYNESNDRWSTNHGGARTRRNQKSPSVQSSTKQDGLFNPNPNPNHVSKKVEKQSITEESSNGGSRNFLVVEQRLKEMKMMDISNDDHDLDIEEVLHYYSRLTCPAYIDIVDKFFLEIYAEFFASSPLTPTRFNPELINSNPKMECSVKS